MATKSSSRRLLFIPVVLGLLFGLLNFLAHVNVLSVWKDMDAAVYDLFLRLKPPIPEDKSLILLNIDDEAITRAGTYPWPRGLMAEGLEALTEFGAGQAVFDIEYLNASPRSVDQNYLEHTLRNRFASGFRELRSSTSELTGALMQKAIGLHDLPSYTEQFLAQMDDTEKRLFEETRKVSVENDSYMGKAMRMFGNSYITLNIIYTREETLPENLRALARERFPYDPVEGVENLWGLKKDFFVPIMEVSSMARAAGATNVERDKDGKLRRIRLLYNVDGKAYAQLGFRPLLDRLGDPQIIARPGSLTLRNAVVDGQTKDIVIPVDDDGNMLINWPSSLFDNSFIPPGYDHQPSFYRLLEYKEDEAHLVDLLQAFGSSQAWELVAGKNPVSQVMEIWDESETLRNAALESGSPQDRDAWVESKVYFYEVMDQFINAGLAEGVGVLLDDAKSGDPQNGAAYDALKEAFHKTHEAIVAQVKVLQDTRVRLSDLFHGATCFIGWTAIASTDFGVTPFDEKYANVGTHASVVNTILQGRFLSTGPWWLSASLALALSLGLVFLIQRMSRTGLQIATGLGATLLLLVGLYLVFLVTGVYIMVLAPALSVFLSFLIFTLAVFFLNEQEKSFLRKAFATYLSGDVIDQIVKDPAMLKLGGDKKWISAMFTDVKGFSTISEKLDPEHLVTLLNVYLSGMSDIILDNRGTIDKYEGDAIIAFFGAPVDYAEHAEAICRSALLMRQKEVELNRYFAEHDLSPTPLLTRIGINTGEMVVGNMGTENKMNYTIMGNAVNLAARLEGVNKQYGSWILSTETTRAEAGDGFVWRRLDRVRVVGINQPLRLYELVGFAEGLDALTASLMERFDHALDLFEGRQWALALEEFKALSTAHPEDGPCKTYIKRCNEFLDKSPSPEWDGVFNLTEK